MTLAAAPPTVALRVPAPGKSRAKNFLAEKWTPEETAVVKPAPDRYAALAQYREKFPGSGRSDDAVFRHFFNQRPDMRKTIHIWTEEQMAPFFAADTVEEAIAEYRRLFPGARRTLPALRREWYALRLDKRGIVPCGRKKGGRNKAPHAGSAREKWQIPMSITEDPKAYHHGAYICEKYKKPYAEALPLWTAYLAEKQRRKEARLQPKPPKVRKVREARPPREKKPEKPRREISARPIVPVVAAPPVYVCGYSVGQKVVHNGAKCSPHFGKTGRVVQIIKRGVTEHLMISFGHESTILLLPEFVKAGGE